MNRRLPEDARRALGWADEEPVDRTHEMCEEARRDLRRAFGVLQRRAARWEPCEMPEEFQ
jgi:hypothetical protein